VVQKRGGAAAAVVQWRPHVGLMTALSGKTQSRFLAFRPTMAMTMSRGAAAAVATSAAAAVAVATSVAA